MVVYNSAKAFPSLYLFFYLFIYLFIYFFLHLFILQAIYIVLQDWRIKDAICRLTELNITLQE